MREDYCYGCKRECKRSPVGETGISCFIEPRDGWRADQNLEPGNLFKDRLYRLFIRIES